MKRQVEYRIIEYVGQDGKSCYTLQRRTWLRWSTEVEVTTAGTMAQHKVVFDSVDDALRYTAAVIRERDEQVRSIEMVVCLYPNISPLFRPYEGQPLKTDA